MNRIFGILVFVLAGLLRTEMRAQATCTGGYTTTAATCQNFTIGNGSAGAIRICLNTNNIPGGGGTSCNPGGSCNPPYSGGGWAPRIAIYTTTGSLVTTWSQSTPAGTCYTLSTTNGYAVIYGLCLTAGTTLSWTTINQCGASVCGGTVACAGQPCATCASACAACGYSSNPSVSTVTSSCPGVTPAIPFGSGQSYTMCATFTAAATTVTFNAIIQSNCGGGNVSNFTWNLYSSCGAGAIQTGNLSNLTFTNLTIGSVYTYCYSFMVPTGSYCQHTIHWPYFVGAAPLPIELIDFKAARSNGTVRLKWSTASEKNSDYFAVERSSDAFHFTEVGRLDASGDSRETMHYLFIDDAPPGTFAYYRIRMVDKDRSFKFSNIEVVDGGSLIENMLLVPNPASGDVSVSFACNSSDAAFLHVYGQNGDLLMSQEVKCAYGMNTARLNVRGLNAGIYYVTMSAASKLYRSKLIIE